MSACGAGGRVQPGEHQSVRPRHPSAVNERQQQQQQRGVLSGIWRRRGQGNVRLREAAAHRGGGDAELEPSDRCQLLPHPGGAKFEHASPSHRDRSAGERGVLLVWGRGVRRAVESGS